MDETAMQAAMTPRQKRFFGSGTLWVTGDMVVAEVTTGSKQGRYPPKGSPGRVAVRSSGSFNVTTATETVEGLHHRFFRLLQRADGYRYASQPSGRLLDSLTTADGLPQPHSSHR